MQFTLEFELNQYVDKKYDKQTKKFKRDDIYDVTERDATNAYII